MGIWGGGGWEGLGGHINACDQTLKSSILGTLDEIQHDARMTVCYTDVQTLIRTLQK